MSVDAPIDIPRGFGPAAADLGQELALAALIGGNLFGRLAMGPSLGQISDKAERGKVLNHSWRRYGIVNSLSLAALVGAWVPARDFELGAPWSRKRDRRLVLVKDIAVGTVAATGLASAMAGVAFSYQEAGGAVPLETGGGPAEETTPRAAKLRRVAAALGAANLASELALLTLNVGLRRGKTRRLLAP